jgi:hypothetical protein
MILTHDDVGAQPKMTAISPSPKAHQELVGMDPTARVQFVESRLIAWIGAARETVDEPFDGSSRLSDLGVDSLKMVDIKFELDQLVGMELDASLFICNPTVHELAKESLSSSGL